MSGTRLGGIAASPGVGVGPAWRFRRVQPQITRWTAEDPAAEHNRYHNARDAAGRELDLLIERQRGLLSSTEAAIFEAQRMMLDDPDLVDRVSKAIMRGASAEGAWWPAVEDVAARLEALPGEVFKTRAADVRDVGERVLRHLLAVREAPELPEHPVAVVAEELTPSDTVGLDATRVVAICTAAGGPTSHAAILARRLGVPAVVGVGPDLGRIEDGVLLLVDGEVGMVIVDPDQATQEAARSRQAARRARRSAAEGAGHDPALTRDRVRIEIAANVGSLADAQAAVRYGADGIGLLRTEFLYLNRTDEPGEDEQVAAYRAIIEVLGARPVVIRTLDIGGDKPVPYLPMAPESNPFLGVRAIRLAERHPHLVRRQLRAILRAGLGHAVRIMFPMVATVDEMRALREMVEETRAALGREGTPAPDDLQIGMMVEIPSAALLAERFVEWTDFFSIGTNDLAQYTLAADRTNAAVAALADALHPAVLRLIRLATDAAVPAGKWVGVCGELAGDVTAVPLLLGLGVTELSMNPPAIPEVKEAVRLWSLAEARKLADQALRLHSARAVREIVGQSQRRV